MRGSPLLRTLLLLIAIGAAAVGLRALTGPSVAQAPQKSGNVPYAPPSATPFVLELSKAAKSVSLETLAGKVLTRPVCGASAVLSGTLELPPDATHIALRITWQDTAAPAHPGFARLTLEPAGRPTLRHIFISDRDIDDIWELSAHD